MVEWRTQVKNLPTPRMAVMDSMNEDGTISQDDVADYKGKAANLLDIWSKRMAKTAGNDLNKPKKEP